MMNRSQLEDSLYKDTVLFPDLVPPFLRKMVPMMYTVGILKVGYIALRCTGFNRALYQTLLNGSSDNIGTPIAIPGETMSLSTKRPIEDGANEEGSAKRAKR